jgi:hypothetical protein
VHDEMGTYEIFLVPVGPDGKGMVYEGDIHVDPRLAVTREKAEGKRGEMNRSSGRSIA